MIGISTNVSKVTKKVHCPFCGGRLCDTLITEKILYNNLKEHESIIIVKCYKCGKKVSINISN